MPEVTIDQIADAMYELVKSTHGKKNLKPMDVTKAMIEEFGEDDVITIDGARFFGALTVTFPHGESASPQGVSDNAQQMTVRVPLRSGTGSSPGLLQVKNEGGIVLSDDENHIVVNW